MTERTAPEVRERLRTYVRETFLYMRPDYRLKDEDRLIAKGILDSMGAVEMVQFLEDEFGVTVKDDEITEANLGSIAAIADFVLQRRDGKRG